MSEINKDYWRKCSTCKKEMPYKAIYQKCSISSCRKSAFCSVDCWDVHNSVLNHKSAWAEEERALSYDQVAGQKPTGKRFIAKGSKPQSSFSTNGDIPEDILIVASKLKSYVKAKHDMNTSANVMDVLSKIVRVVTDEAVLKAREEGRKTLMDRDFKNVNF